MTNPKERAREALTKRALERQFRRAGVTRKTAETEVARLTHDERWRRLSLKDRAQIAWESLINPRSKT